MKRKDHHFDLWLNYDGQDIRATGHITPYCPAVMYLSNGDPGYPEEGGEIEDLVLTDDKGEVIEDADGKIGEALQDDIYERCKE